MCGVSREKCHFSSPATHPAQKGGGKRGKRKPCTNGDVETVEGPEERETADGNVAEARVDLAPAVAPEGAVGLLEADDKARDALDVAAVERAEQHEDLHRAERVQQVRVVADVARKAARLGVVAAQHPVDHAGRLGRAQRVHEAQRRQAPVRARHAQVLRHPVLEVVLALLLQAPHKRLVLVAHQLRVPPVHRRPSALGSCRVTHSGTHTHTHAVSC